MNDEGREPGFLEFRPESLEALQSRYTAAIIKPIDPIAVVHGLSPQPGTVRRHVLDFESGLRLIVSREWIPGTRETCIHFSGGAHGQLHRWAEKLTRRHGPQRALDEFMQRAIAGFRDVSGHAGPVEFAGLSAEKGIPHWIVNERVRQPEGVQA